jgi:hypothetical protein
MEVSGVLFCSAASLWMASHGMTCLFPVSQYSCVRPIGKSPKALVPLTLTKTACFNSFISARSSKV